MILTLDLPTHVWRSVRYALRYQRDRLGRKATRAAERVAPLINDRDIQRVANLTTALVAIDLHLSTEEEPHDDADPR